ncbi:MAG: hypothetical protein WD397_00665 [Wenzhouxiangellaceae bacterium]
MNKLKYKDLELEFEKEARGILADAERDLPDPPKPEPSEVEDHGIRFSLARLEPSTEILESWRHLELKLRELSGGNERKRSTGYLVRELANEGRISKETESVVLSLSSLRNKVAHTDEEVISRAASSSFKDSVARVISALESESA